MANKFYVTTPIYYVNDVPHIGHAYTTLAADVLTRYFQEKIGRGKVFFLTGTDEHGQKVAQAAKEKGVSPREYADYVAPRFEEAWKLLNIQYDYFIRTTDPKHEKVVSEFLQKIYDNGFIYKDTYKGLYCVGCEKFLTETELINGKCPLHPNKEPVYQEEENYFLKLGELSRKVLEKIENGEYEIWPTERKNEVIGRLKGKVEDISVSRSQVPWGIPIPWDKSQTIYVWIDALINYYSATRFLKGKEKFWPADVHLIGKDILWFHAVIWQALLIAARIDLPKKIAVHGYFTIDGQKMSKSLGNVISPKQLVDRYGVDGARYLLMSAYPFGSDGDISLARFDQKYNADLANGLGNLISRSAKLLEIANIDTDKLGLENPKEFSPELAAPIEKYQIDKALSYIWQSISTLDNYINKTEPWKKERLHEIVLWTNIVKRIREIAFDLKPFLPETAEKIERQFKGPKIKSEAPLFPRVK